MLQSLFHRGQSGKSPGDADQSQRLINVRKLLVQRYQLSVDEVNQCRHFFGSHRIRAKEPFGQAHRTDIDADRLGNTFGIAADQLRAAATCVDHQQFSGQ